MFAPTRLAQQRRQLGDIRRDPSRLVLAEQLGRNVRFTPKSGHWQSRRIDLFGVRKRCRRAAWPCLLVLGTVRFAKACFAPGLARRGTARCARDLCRLLGPVERLPALDQVAPGAPQCPLIPNSGSR